MRVCVCVCLIWLSIKLTCNCIYMYVLNFGVKCNVVAGSGAENVCLLWVQLRVFVLDLFYSLSAYKMDDHYQWFCCLLFLSITVVSWAKRRIVRGCAFLSTPLWAKAPNLGLSRKEMASLLGDIFILEWSSCEDANRWLQHESINLHAVSCDPLAGGQVTQLPEVRQPTWRRSGLQVQNLSSLNCAVYEKINFFFSRRFLTVPSWFCPYHSAREHF